MAFQSDNVARRVNLPPGSRTGFQESVNEFLKEEPYYANQHTVLRDTINDSLRRDAVSPLNNSEECVRMFFSDPLNQKTSKYFYSFD